MPGFADCKEKIIKSHTSTHIHTQRKEVKILKTIFLKKTGGAQILSHIFIIKYVIFVWFTHEKMPRVRSQLERINLNPNLLIISISFQKTILVTSTLTNVISKWGQYDITTAYLDFFVLNTKLLNTDHLKKNKTQNPHNTRNDKDSRFSSWFSQKKKQNFVLKKHSNYNVFLVTFAIDTYHLIYLLFYL